MLTHISKNLTGFMGAILVFAIAVGVSYADNDKPTTSYPIRGVDDWVKIATPGLSFTVVDGDEFKRYYVAWDGLNVKLRTDGEDSTSLEIANEAREYRRYPEATIWVPCAEDVVVWTNYIAKERVAWEKFNERSKHHCRILPPDFECLCASHDTEATNEMIFYGVWDHEDKESVFLRFIWNSSLPTHSSVDRGNIIVKLRIDGKVYTSVELGEEEEHQSNFVKSAVILVPLAEDVAVWENWLEESKARHKAYKVKDRMPRRVLPQPQED